MNYITLHIRDKEMAEVLIHVFEKKVDKLIWGIVAMWGLMILLNIFNYLTKTTQAVAQLFMIAFTTVLPLIICVTMYYVPGAKKHVAKVIIFVSTVATDLTINLALRNLLPVEVDMKNLDFF